MNKIDFVKYNRDRLPQYRTETTVWSSPEGPKVRKRALSSEGEGHIQNILVNQALIERSLPGANLPHLIRTKEGVEFDFIEGSLIESMLLDKASKGDREGFLNILNDYRSFLTSLGKGDRKELQGVVRDLLADVPEVMNDDMMPVANLDLTFDNVIVDEDGRYWITDIEWVFDSPVPCSFIFYRSLYVLYLKQHRRLDPVLTFPEALVETGVPEDLWEPYRQACESFIDLVFGKDRPHLIPQAYKRETQQLASLAQLQSREQQLYAAQLELDATKRALEEMMAHAKLREERLQQQEKRLGELSDETESGKAELTEKDALLSTLRVDLESERLRLSALHGQYELERDHAFQLIRELENEKGRLSLITVELESERSNSSALHGQYELERDHAFQLIRELEGERTLSQQLRDELSLSQTDLLIAREAMVRQDNEIAELRKAVSALIKERDETFVLLQEMTDRFVGKQAELMTMSDWARSMQVRLEFMESVPTIRRLEKLATLQKQAMDKLKSDGLFRHVQERGLAAGPVQGPAACSIVPSRRTSRLWRPTPKTGTYWWSSRSSRGSSAGSGRSSWSRASPRTGTRCCSCTWT